MSDIERKPLYTAADLAGFDYARQLGAPGEYPFTRGIHPTMYGGRLWTMRQFAGFGSAQDTNQRYKFLLEHGQTGLSVAFDFPTLMGYDSDHPRAEGEVGKCGVAIASLADMEDLFRGIPLDKVSTSMTINGPAAILFCFYVAAAERQGVPSHALRGTVQNDILKEYMAQHAWCYPIEPALRLIVDLFQWGAEHAPQWNTVSISGYHIREAGATAAQELAYETGVPNVIDPLGGSYYVEAMTDQLEREAEAIFSQIDEVGGVVSGLEQGWFQRKIAESAARQQWEIEQRRRVVVGVNEFVTDEPELTIPLLKIGEEVDRRQREGLARLRKERDNDACQQALDAL